MSGCPFHDARLGAIARAHGMSAAQVCFRWTLQRGAILATGTGHNATKAALHSKDDLGTYDPNFELTGEEMAYLEVANEERHLELIQNALVMQREHKLDAKNALMCAYVRALAPVVLDPAAAKTQEDHAAATVADALDGISEDFDEAENEAEEARDNWVKGEDCECRPDRYGYRKWGCPNCGDYHCHDEDCYDPDQIECDCAAENNPLPDPAAFVKDRLEEVDALLARGRARAARRPPRAGP